MPCIQSNMILSKCTVNTLILHVRLRHQGINPIYFIGISILSDIITPNSLLLINNIKTSGYDNNRNNTIINHLLMIFISHKPIKTICDNGWLDNPKLAALLWPLGFLAMFLAAITVVLNISSTTNTVICNATFVLRVKFHRNILFVLFSQRS